MATNPTARRGRPPRGQESKLAAVIAFSKNPPKNWEALSARERKERVCKAVGLNLPYLQQLITKSESLKDFFGIIRRRRRVNSRVRLGVVVRHAYSLEMNDLISLSKSIRAELKRRSDLALLEANAR